MLEYTPYFGKQGNPLEAALQAAADICFAIGSPIDPANMDMARKIAPKTPKAWPSIQDREEYLKVFRGGGISTARQAFQSCREIWRREHGTDINFADCIDQTKRAVARP
jgi:hypothetical protein